MAMEKFLNNKINGLSEGAAGWRSSDIAASMQWRRPITDGEKEGLLEGLAKYERSGVSFLTSTGEDFSFQGVESLIADVRWEVANGTGFILLKNFPIEGLSVEQIEALYWGFCNHLGVMRPQGKDSGLLKSVRNAGGNYRAQSGRGYNTNAKLDYHTDFADLVALLCINAAKQGGESLVTSSVALRDELAKRDQAMVDALFSPVDYSRQDEHAGHQAPFYSAPIFSQSEGSFCCRYTRNHIRYADRHEGAAAPSDLQQRAMDELDALAANTAFTYEMTLEPGDLQILNNHTVLHSRREFIDVDEPGRQRHLLRAWIATPDSQPLDVALEEAYFDHRPGAVRGGILGQCFDADKLRYTQRAAAYHGMSSEGFLNACA